MQVRPRYVSCEDEQAVAPYARCSLVMDLSLCSSSPSIHPAVAAAVGGDADQELYNGANSEIRAR